MGRLGGQERDEIPGGVLYLLILRTLSRGVMHGYQIAEHIQELSGEVLLIEEGTLYPTLQRMFVKGWVVAEWGHSINNRRARYYRLTPAGRKQLQKEMALYERVSAAILKVLQPAV
jgi:PadR family transcriptional regulator, regulatory protein PadR